MEKPTESRPSADKREKADGGHRLGPDVVGRQLRIMYNDVIAQPIPARFTDLLKELDKQGKVTGGGLL